MTRRSSLPGLVSPLHLCAAFSLLAAFPTVSATKPARMQSQIKGLLVVQLGGGEFAGTASQMNATVVPGKKGTFTIKFNQTVGSMMEKARVEVEKFMRVRHGDKVLAKLKAIVKLAPNHLSARILYLHGIKKGPKNLSLPGSLTAIDKASSRLGGMLSDGSFMDTGHDDVLRNFISEMKRLRSMLDQRTKAYADTYEELADFMRTIRGRKILSAQLRRELQGKVRRVDSERRKLLENKEIREELMIE